MNTQHEPLHTVPEVAVRLRLAPEGVRRLIREGRLRAARVGKQYLIESSAVDAFLADATHVVT